jgi:hypothetical protein
MTIIQYLTGRISSAMDSITGRKYRKAEEERQYQSAVSLADVLIRFDTLKERSRTVIAESDKVGEESRRLSEEFRKMRIKGK